jgi:hypothetical protein
LPFTAITGELESLVEFAAPGMKAAPALIRGSRNTSRCGSGRFCSSVRPKVSDRRPSRETATVTAPAVTSTDSCRLARPSVIVTSAVSPTVRRRPSCENGRNPATSALNA